MIIVAEAYFRFSRTLPGEALDRDAEAILLFAEQLVRDRYVDRYQSYVFRVQVRIERGSTRIWVTVTALVGVLTVYGDIRQSLEFLVKDAAYIGSTVFPTVADKLGMAPEYSQKRRGIPGKLLRLFVRVESGELSPEEATSLATSILLREGGPEVIYEAPGITERLSSEFREASGHLSLNLLAQQVPSSVPNVPDLPPPSLPPQRRIGIVMSRDEKGKLRVRSY